MATFKTKKLLPAISSERLEKMVEAESKKRMTQNFSGGIVWERMLEIMHTLGKAFPSQLLKAYNEHPDTTEEQVLGDTGAIRGQLQKRGLKGGGNAKGEQKGAILWHTDNAVYKIALSKVQGGKETNMYITEGRAK